MVPVATGSLWRVTGIEPGQAGMLTEFAGLYVGGGRADYQLGLVVPIEGTPNADLARPRIGLLAWLTLRR